MLGGRRSNTKEHHQNSRLITNCRIGCSGNVLLSSVYLWGLLCLVLEAVITFLSHPWEGAAQQTCRAAQWLEVPADNWTGNNWNLVQVSDGLIRKLHCFGLGKWLLTVSESRACTGKWGSNWWLNSSTWCHGFPEPCNTGLPGRAVTFSGCSFMWLSWCVTLSTRCQIKLSYQLAWLFGCDFEAKT